MYGATVLVVAPLGGDQHVGFIVNRPTEVTLGKLFPSDGPAQKLVDPVYLGGPVSTEFIFALVQRADSASAQAVELAPGLYAAVDAKTVDHIIRSEADHARFVMCLPHQFRPATSHIDVNVPLQIACVMEPDMQRQSSWSNLHASPRPKLSQSPWTLGFRRLTV